MFNRIRTKANPLGFRANQHPFGYGLSYYTNSLFNKAIKVVIGGVEYNILLKEYSKTIVAKNGRKKFYKVVQEGNNKLFAYVVWQSDYKNLVRLLNNYYNVYRGFNTDITKEQGINLVPSVFDSLNDDIRDTLNTYNSNGKVEPIKSRLGDRKKINRRRDKISRIKKLERVLQRGTLSAEKFATYNKELQDHKRGL